MTMSSAQPGSRTSDLGTGQQSVSFTLGPGTYRLWAAAISSTRLYVENASINYVYKAGDGTEITIPLVSGFMKRYLPLCLNREVILRGPGTIKSQVYHEESNIHTFSVEYMKLSQLGETELFIR